MQEFVELNVVLFLSVEEFTETEGGFYVDVDESLGFPGGSLGHPGTAGAGMLSIGLLGHNLDLVV